MRTVILSDAHSNMEGLQAVLRHAEAGGGFDRIWCAGDIVGYGADPGAVLAALRGCPLAAVAGNHDRAAAGLMGVEEFNPPAAEAALWNGKQLTPGERAFLSALPLTRVEEGFTLVHGSLRDPVWEYLLSAEQAAVQFMLQETRYSVVGHSHLTFWAEEDERGRTALHAVDDGTVLELGERRLIVNPGSSGQPRDGDPRAAYVLYDEASASVTWHRVEYDMSATQRKIRAAGLDPWLAERLSVGM